MKSALFGFITNQEAVHPNEDRNEGAELIFIPCGECVITDIHEVSADYYEPRTP